MTITVTPYGAGSTDGGTYIFPTGSIQLNEGDWIVAAIASDNYNSSAFIQYNNAILSPLSKYMTANNSGNVATWFIAARVMGDASSASGIGVNGLVSADANAVSIYIVTGIDPIDWETMDVGATGTAWGNSTTSRWGNYVMLSAGTITKVSWYLRNLNSATGTVYCRIYKASDFSLVQTMGSLDVSTLGTSFSTVDFDSATATITADGAYYIVLDHNGTPLSAAINVNYSSTPPPQIHHAHFDGTDWIGGDVYTVAWMHLYGTAQSFGLSPYDSATATGSGTPATTTRTGVAPTVGDLYIGAAGIECDVGEAPYVGLAAYRIGTDGEQSAGTSGNGTAANITIVSSYKIATTTDDLQVYVVNDGRDWATIMVLLPAAADTGVAVQPSAETASITDTPTAAIPYLGGLNKSEAIGVGPVPAFDVPINSGPVRISGIIIE